MYVAKLSGPVACDQVSVIVDWDYGLVRTHFDIVEDYFFDLGHCRRCWHLGRDGMIQSRSVGETLDPALPAQPWYSPGIPALAQEARTGREGVHFGGHNGTEWTTRETVPSMTRRD